MQSEYEPLSEEKAVSANLEPKRRSETIEQLIGMLAMDTRRKAVNSLLAGNDTLCFTTEQYKTAYQRESKTDDWVWRIDDDLAGKHLRSLPELVREVRPGVWAAV